MKKYLFCAALGALLASAPVLAHHAAEGIIDEEVYATIDEMVADTPHADLDFSDMGGDTTEITGSTRSVRDVENLIDDGLLHYAAMLDGSTRIGAARPTIRQADRGAG